MPDLDRVERTLSHLWQAPYRLLKGNQSAEIVAEGLVRSVAAELREQGGVPEFELFLQACIAPEQRSEPVRTLSDVSHFIEQRFGQVRKIKLLSSAARRVQAKVVAGRVLPAPSQLASEFLRTLIRHHFFAKVTLRLVGEKRRFKDVTEAREFERRIWLGS